MAGSQDSGEETAQGEPVRRKAQCKTGPWREVAEPGAGAGGRERGR